MSYLYVMRRRMLFKLGVSIVVFTGIILFYLVNVQEDAQTRNRYLTDSLKFHDNALEQEVKHHNENKDLDKTDLSNNEGKNIPVVGNDVKDTPIHFQKDFREIIATKTPSDIYEKTRNANENIDQVSLQDKKLEDFYFRQKDMKPVISSTESIPKDAIHLCVVVCGERQTEALTLLKSAILVTSTRYLVFHIVTEPPLQQFFKAKLEFWPAQYRLKMSYRIYNVTFPNGEISEAWRKLFKPCASQRLFLPSLLKSVESLIYVDTDVLFLQSLAGVWSHFAAFNSSHKAALVQEAEDSTAGWYNRFASHPYYGNYGVNSGVMLMNLTRLRDTNWLSEMHRLYKQYHLMIPWGDQDLINIYFSQHPEELYLLSCEWNYRSDHCKYMSNCKTAETHGVSIMHGSRRTFYGDKEPAFAAVLYAFQDHMLGDDLELQFMYNLKENLKKAKPSNCGKISQLFTRQLEAQIKDESELKLAGKNISLKIDNGNTNFEQKDKLTENKDNIKVVQMDISETHAPGLDFDDVDGFKKSQSNVYVSETKVNRLNHSSLHNKRDVANALL